MHGGQPQPLPSGPCSIISVSGRGSCSARLLCPWNSPGKKAGVDSHPHLQGAVALAQVGEAPHVAQAHAEAHAGQHVLRLVVPLGPRAALLPLDALQLAQRWDPGLQARVGQRQPHHGGPGGSASSASGHRPEPWGFIGNLWHLTPAPGPKGSVSRSQGRGCQTVNALSAEAPGPSTSQAAVSSAPVQTGPTAQVSLAPTAPCPHRTRRGAETPDSKMLPGSAGCRSLPTTPPLMVRTRDAPGAETPDGQMVDAAQPLWALRRSSGSAASAGGPPGGALVPVGSPPGAQSYRPAVSRAHPPGGGASVPSLGA